MGKWRARGMKAAVLFLWAYKEDFFFTPLIEFIIKDETLCMDKGVVLALVFQKVTQVDRGQHTAIGGALPEHCIKLGSAQELTTKQLDFTVVQTTVCWSVAFLLHTRINTSGLRMCKGY